MRTEKCHFWIGWFETVDLYFDFVGEDNSRYDLEDYDDIPVSKFAKSQGKVWINHDLMESGFEEPIGDLKKQFKRYSYSCNWAAELEKRCSGMNLDEINTLIFLNEDQIPKPKSVQGSGFRLDYIGVIEYEI